MATTSCDMSEGVTVVTSMPAPDGRTAVTLSGPLDLVTLVLDGHALRELHRETGPERTALGSPGLHLVEVKG